MNTCTICNSRSNISVKLPQIAPDRKLAFVESVCEELIKDRFGPWYVFESSVTAHDAVRSAAAGWDLGFTTPRDRPSASVPPAVAGGVLGRKDGDPLHGIFVVPTSRRGLECSRTPVTIVPGTDPRSILAQPRGSPRLALAF